MTVYTDDFARADGPALGSIPGSSLAWAAVNGTWTLASGTMRTSTAPASTPIVAVAVQSGDAEISGKVPATVAGGALYARVADGANWLRLRWRRWQVSTSSQYYITETLWNARRWFDNYIEYANSQEVRTYSASYTAWSSYGNTTEITACRSSQPTYGVTDDVDAYGQAVAQYRWVLYEACAGGGNKWVKQARSRSRVVDTASYSSRVERLPYSLQSSAFSAEAFAGSPYLAAWSVYAKQGTSASQSTSANDGDDQYQNTTISTVSQYWAQFADTASTHPADTSTGSTRQVGPYTQTTTDDYYTLTLEKCVAGVVTVLATVDTTTASPLTLKLRTQGSTVTAYRNGVQVAQVTESALSSANKFGMGAGVGTSTSGDVTYSTLSFDDFTVEPLAQLPSAPTGLALSAARVRRGGPLTATFTYVDPDNEALVSRQYRYRPAGSSGAWTEPAASAGSTPSVSIDTSTMLGDYEISVRTADAGGFGPYAATPVLVEVTAASAKLGGAVVPMSPKIRSNGLVKDTDPVRG